MKLYREYTKKLKTPDEAVKIIKSGDRVDYTMALGFPALLDAALAKRKEELHNVRIRGEMFFTPIQVVECDPQGKHFFYSKHSYTADVVMMSVTPMDKHGYFNLSCTVGIGKRILDNAKVVILEINEHLPRLHGGLDEVIHISEVDYIVEGKHGPLPEVPVAEPTEDEFKLAKQIISHISSGSTLHLGMDGVSSAIGALLLDSDIKELGMHTSFCSDIYVELYEAGKLTNKMNTFHRGKGLLGIAVGTEKLYEWVDENPCVTAAPIEYINASEQMKDVFCIAQHIRQCTPEL